MFKAVYLMLEAQRKKLQETQTLPARAAGPQTCPMRVTDPTSARGAIGPTSTARAESRGDPYTS